MVHPTKPPASSVVYASRLTLSQAQIIFRDPRWGRGHETYGEDPCLTAKLGCAYIRGIQGKDPDHLKAAARAIACGNIVATPDLATP